MNPLLSLLLSPHPSSATTPELTVSASVAAQATGGLRIDYRLRGDLRGVALPPAGERLPPDRLWSFSCFEAFLAADAGYREFNFAVNGQWAVFDFSAYRQRTDAAAEIPPPQLATRSADGAFELTASLPAGALPPVSGPGTWRLGLSAVLLDTAVRRHYFALVHPAPQPDFHDPRGWILRFDRKPPGLAR
jgi:hypothetical protein